MFSACFHVTISFTIQKVSYTSIVKREIRATEVLHLTPREGLELFPIGKTEVAPFSSKPFRLPGD